MEKVRLFDAKVHRCEYFGNICNFDMVNKHYCAIKELLGTQQQEILTNSNNDDIISDSMKIVLKSAKQKKRCARYSSKRDLLVTLHPSK